jgi:hypothetical protein
MPFFLTVMRALPRVMAPPPHAAIYITAFDEPIESVKRRKGAMNVGVYCRCREFVAFSTAKPGQPPAGVEFTAAQPILLACPYCKVEEHRHIEDIHQLLLTKDNERRLT